MYVDPARLTYLTICQIKVKFLVVLRTSCATIINCKVILHIHKKILSFLCQYGWICNKVSLFAYRTHKLIHKIRILNFSRIFHLPNELIVIDEKTQENTKKQASLGPLRILWSILITKQKTLKLFFSKFRIRKNMRWTRSKSGFFKEFLSVFKRENSGFAVSELVAGFAEPDNYNRLTKCDLSLKW